MWHGLSARWPRPSCRWAAMRRGRRAGCARRWRCGAGRRWRTLRTNGLRRARSRGWRSCGWERSRGAWRPIWRSDGTRRWWASWRRWCGEHPLRERVRGQLMLALYRCGRQGAALEVYRDGRRRTVDELGLEPGPALRELQEKILDQSADFKAPATAPDMRGDGAQERRSPRRRSRKAAAMASGGVGGRWRRGGVGRVRAGGAVGGRRRSRGGGRATLELTATGWRGWMSHRQPGFALPLPGRPTALTATGNTVWAATVDSAWLTARTRAPGRSCARFRFA